MSIVNPTAYDFKGRDKFDIAEQYVDELFPHFPEYAEFQVYNIIQEYQKINGKNPELVAVQREISLLLIDRFHYVDKTKGYPIYLNDTGRKAKSLGGHFAYKKYTSVSTEGYQNKQNMVKEETILSYFYKQNRTVSLEELFARYGNDDRILNPISEWVDDEWLKVDENNILAWQITGDGKLEYERRQEIKNPQPTNIVTIHNNNSIVNLGQIEGDIYHNIGNLNNSGQQDISKSIKELVKAIKDTNEIQAEQKNEYLTTLKLLSEEALKPKVKRLPNSILKQTIQYLVASLNTFSSISTISGINLTNITDFFNKSG